MNAKLRKLIVVNLCLIMMLIVTDVNVFAGVTDEDNPVVISYLGYTSAVQSGSFNTNETDHYYKFSIGTSSSFADITAVTLRVPTGCDYGMEIKDITNNKIYQFEYSQTSNNKIIIIPKNLQRFQLI